MPKTRPVDRRHQSFQVSPWQEKRSRAQHDVEDPTCSIEHAKLIAIPPSAGERDLKEHVVHEIPNPRCVETSPPAEALRACPEATVEGEDGGEPQLSASRDPTAISESRGAISTMGVKPSQTDYEPLPSAAPEWRPLKRKARASSQMANHHGADSGGIKWEGKPADEDDRVMPADLEATKPESSRVCPDTATRAEAKQVPLLISRECKSSRTVGWDSGESSPCHSSDLVQTLQGVCNVAILPSGHMSGHVVDSKTKVCLGLTGHRLHGGASAVPGCMISEDTEVLLLTIINFKTECEAYAVVCKNGGDLACMEPAEDWHIRQFVPEALHGRNQPEYKTEVSFSADRLLVGDLADKHLHKFNPKLVGREAVVNMGVMRISELPQGFMTELPGQKSAPS